MFAWMVDWKTRNFNEIDLLHECWRICLSGQAINLPVRRTQFHKTQAHVPTTHTVNVRVNKWQNCLYSKSTQKDEDTRAHDKCIQPKCTCKQTRCSMVIFALLTLPLFFRSFLLITFSPIHSHAHTHAPSSTPCLNIIFLHIAPGLAFFLFEKNLFRSHSLAHFSFFLLLFSSFFLLWQLDIFANGQQIIIVQFASPSVICIWCCYFCTEKNCCNCVLVCVCIVCLLCLFDPLRSGSAQSAFGLFGFDFGIVMLYLYLFLSSCREYHDRCAKVYALALIQWVCSHLTNSNCD